MNSKKGSHKPTSSSKALRSPDDRESTYPFLGHRFRDSELVIGLVGAVGTPLRKVSEELQDRLSTFRYIAEKIHISSDAIPRLCDTVGIDRDDEYKRISALMTIGNETRKKTRDNSVLALGAASIIRENRPGIRDKSREDRPRHAYIINSLKHPDEVTRLRHIYSEGFYLIGVYSDEARRHTYLTEDRRIDASSATGLMLRDEDEQMRHGQRTRDTFHLSDFFVHEDGNWDKLKNSLWRILDIIFGHPYKTPTFDEYAMFMAFSAALRSGDLSRQVGAVLAKNNEIIATGANDCPSYGGGLYWPRYCEETSGIEDNENGRDYTRDEDSNQLEKQRIIEDILKQAENLVENHENLREVLKRSRLDDITEYGRAVHAEMEALLCCSRNNIHCRDATLYCTTFPCHNCAKHIVAAGVNRVIYIEPYPKSRAIEFHDDSIRLGFKEKGEFVVFEPFVGVGPRRFFDLFSMNLGFGQPLLRKDATGHTLDWTPEHSNLRIQMLPFSYLEKETMAASVFNTYRKEIKDEPDG